MNNSSIEDFNNFNISDEELELANKVLKEIDGIFKGDCSGHDYWHSLRVYKNAMKLSMEISCDRIVVLLASLLHDVDDEKLFKNTKNENTKRIMSELNVSKDLSEKVIEIIDEVSFKGEESVVPQSIEGKIVQDADRLDAMGAIGIARTFAFGGSKGREIYNPNIPPQKNLNKETYINSEGSSINHFYEKLFLLKDMMNTEPAKRIAEEKDAFMHLYLERFLIEWEGI